MTKPRAIIDPWPRTKAMIFSDQSWAELAQSCAITDYWGQGRMPRGMVDAALPDAALIIGQTHLPAADIERAQNLKAVINVKGNWEPHIDYDALHKRGIHTLSIAPCMAHAVAEWSLGAAIDLLRGITCAHRRFATGQEAYGIGGNQDAKSLFDAKVGLIGMGNLGQALRPLLTPFGCTVSVHDPWLSSSWIEAQGCHASTLNDLLQTSDVIFILAGVTQENEGFLNRRLLERIKPDASVVLASRAEVVGFNDFVELAEAGRFRAAIDVFPEEPVPADDAVRTTQHILLSSHRAGGTFASYDRIARWMISDIKQILCGLNPLHLQPADPARAASMRSR